MESMQQQNKKSF